MSAKSIRKLQEDELTVITPFIPDDGVTEGWLDQMILAGRLFIGQENDHRRACLAIRRSNRQHLQLVPRLS